MDNLLLKAKNGSHAAFAELCDTYSPLINTAVSGFAQNHAVDAEDLRQEALIAFYIAARSYENSDEVSFGLYAKICIRNRLIGVLRKQKGAEPIAELPEDTPSCEDPEREFIDREAYEKLLSVIDDVLTDYEKSVFSLYLADKSYEEIATALEKTVKSVDNALCRIKAKIKKRI